MDDRIIEIACRMALIDMVEDTGKLPHQLVEKDNCYSGENQDIFDKKYDKYCEFVQKLIKDHKQK